MKTLLQVLTGFVVAAACVATPAQTVYLDAGLKDASGVELREFRQITAPSEVLRGAKLSIADANSAASGRAAAGRFGKIAAQSATEQGNASGQMLAALFDSITASAPGLQPGDPITYVATMAIDGSTTATPDPESFASFSGQLELGGSVVYRAIGSNDTMQRTLRVVLNTTVGASFPLIARINAVTNVTAAGPQAAATSASNRSTRIVLSSPTAGANITGSSGYAYTRQ